VTSRRFAFALAIASLLAVARDTSAQPRSPISLEATVGMGFGSTDGDYRQNRTGLAADALLAARLRPTAGGALVVGLGASVQGSGASSLECRPAPGGGCVSRFPDFYAFAPLAGWENGHATLRAMAGPAFVHAMGAGQAVGIQGRLDVVAATIRRVAVIASLRPTWIPDYRGDAVGLLAVGLGLRFR
jgi:hypothetical protein